VNGDYTAPAALAAKALGKPVKLVLTRPDDLRFDSFRSPLCAPIRLAVASAGGCLQGCRHGLAQRRFDPSEHRQHDRNGLGGGFSGEPSCERRAGFTLMKNEHWP
jgi:hypothetical protein